MWTSSYRAAFLKNVLKAFHSNAENTNLLDHQLSKLLEGRYFFLDLKVNLVAFQNHAATSFKTLTEQYKSRMENKDYIKICRRWQSTEGELGSESIRGKLIRGDASAVSLFGVFKQLAFKISLPSKFLFRGLGKEIDDVEDLTATSLSAEVAWHLYSFGRLMIIYVADQEVHGLPIKCASKTGSSSDLEILLIDCKSKLVEDVDVDKDLLVKIMTLFLYETMKDKLHLETNDTFEPLSRETIKVYVYK